MPQGCGCGSGGGGTGSCADVAECVNGMISGSACIGTTGSGASRQIVLRISPQTDNLATCTADGLYVSGTITPNFCAPPDLVSPFFIADGRGPYAPWGSPAYLAAVASHRLDGIYNYTWATPDGRMVWGITVPTTTRSEYLDGDYSTRGWDNQGPASGATHGDIDANTWVRSNSPAGNATGLMPPTFMVSSPTSISRDSPDGGWWGFAARPFRPMLLGEALDIIACRSRAFLIMNSTPWNSSSPTASILAETLAAEGRTAGVTVAITWSLTSAAGILRDAGVATAAIITASYAGDLEALRTAGFRTVIFNPDTTNAAYVTEFYDDPDFTAVAQLPLSRHYKTEAVLTAGADGIICADPVYARGYDGTAATNYYEKEAIHYDHNREIGTSTWQGEHNAGYASLEWPGWYLYTTSSATRYDNAVLFGNLDIDDPSNFEITYVASYLPDFQTAGTFQKVGIFFGNTVDCDPWIQNLDTATPNDQLNGYALVYRTGSGAAHGRMAVFKWEAGAVTTLADTLIAGPAVNFRSGLIVTPSSFTFINYTSTWDINQQVTINDPDFRGPYIWGVTETNANTPFRGQWTNVTVGPPPSALLFAESGGEDNETEIALPTRKGGGPGPL